MYWVTRSKDEPAGPMTAEAIAESLRAGELPADVLVCQVGTSVWKPIEDMVEVAQAALELEPDTEQVPMDHLTASLENERQEDPDDLADDLPTIRPNAPPEEGY